MTRAILTLAVLLMLGTVLAACGSGRRSIETIDGEWFVAQSPITGKCYEVMWWTMGSEVSCDLLLTFGQAYR